MESDRHSAGELRNGSTALSSLVMKLHFYHGPLLSLCNDFFSPASSVKRTELENDYKWWIAKNMEMVVACLK